MRSFWFIFSILAAIYATTDAAAFVSEKAVELPKRRTGPPIGAKYESIIRLPVIGKQVFSLHILSDTRAHLIVAGMLVLDESVSYTVDSDGRLAFVLSDYALKKMRRFRTKLKEVGYNIATDTPYVKVAPPLPRAVTLVLKRKNAPLPMPASLL
jgi:hypothetical protein